MKIFVYEHITATFAENGSPLYREGLLMRNALEEDLTQIAGIEILKFIRKQELKSGLAFDSHFCKLVNQADAVWLIAPEFDHILFYLAKRIEQLGKPLLSPSSAVIELTTDKRKLAEFWGNANVCTPSLIDTNEYPFVYKPFDGAGSTATMLVCNQTDWHTAQNHASEAGYASERMIRQKYIPGKAASVSFLVGHQQKPIALLPCEQVLSADGFFSFQVSRLLVGNEAIRAKAIAEQAIFSVYDAIPFQGYVGVDVVLGDDGQDYAIEINPRLTTSYIELRKHLPFNICQRLIVGNQTI